VVLPFRVDRLFVGAAETLVVDDVRLDVPLADERFLPPAR